MSLCPPTHLSLPQWDAGSRKIRFMYLVNLTSFRLTACPHKTQVIPLFLGADVLSSTDVRTENHPRYHAKFAKKGLATKIQFSSEFRFYGLKVPTGNNSLWFYSIQGLFRVAFELYSRQEQLSVLETFQDIWKTQISDSFLNMTYILSRQLDSAVCNNMCSAEASNQISQPQHCRLNREFTDTSSSGIHDGSADHDYCSFSNQSSVRNEVLFSVKQKLRSLDDNLSSDTQCQSEKLESVLLLLETLNKYLNGDLEEKDVTQTVLALLQARDWGSLYSSSLLSSLGQWLGQQFHAANSSISQKVESFKVQHIERISDLPPADELVTELFPEAMQTLLLHWMGLSEESTVDKRRSEYPILLLILEFANHNLITGVAHVLYSSLICK